MMIVVAAGVEHAASPSPSAAATSAVRATFMTHLPIYPVYRSVFSFNSCPTGSSPAGLTSLAK